jgi:hypothetical protein
VRASAGLLAAATSSDDPKLEKTTEVENLDIGHITVRQLLKTTGA